MTRIKTVSQDYITQGDGSDALPFNASAIQQALTDAGPYGSVYVQRGTYLALTNIVQKGAYQQLICEAGVKIVVDPTYALQTNTNGLICVGYDGAITYDGFLLDGNGLILEGNGLDFQLLDITTAETKVHDIVFRNFSVQNTTNWGIIVGSPISQDIETRVENVLIENFKGHNCYWLLIYQSELVTVRHGRWSKFPHGTPHIELNGILVTAQATNDPSPHTTRLITFEDLDLNSNRSDTGGDIGDTILEVQGGSTSVEPGKTYDILFRRCRFRTDPGRPPPGGVYIDDNNAGAGSGLVESLSFQDCIFDGPQVERKVNNPSTGYIVFDHCRFLNSAGWKLNGDLLTGGATYLTRPIIWRRYVGTPVNWPNQNVPVAVGPSPFTILNTYQCKILVVVRGGSVSLIQITLRGGTPVATGQTAGTFLLNEGDSLTVTFGTAPTVTAIPFDR